VVPGREGGLRCDHERKRRPPRAMAARGAAPAPNRSALTSRVSRIPWAGSFIVPAPAGLHYARLGTTRHAMTSPAAAFPMKPAARWRPLWFPSFMYRWPGPSAWICPLGKATAVPTPSPNPRASCKTLCCLALPCRSSPARTRRLANRHLRLRIESGAPSPRCPLGPVPPERPCRSRNRPLGLGHCRSTRTAESLEGAVDHPNRSGSSGDSRAGPAFRQLRNVLAGRGTCPGDRTARATPQVRQARGRLRRVAAQKGPLARRPLTRERVCDGLALPR